MVRFTNSIDCKAKTNIDSFCASGTLVCKETQVDTICTKKKNG